MRLRQIEVFHAVYSSGSMTSAAAMLNVSQPSVSKVLAHAEQQLGYLLFERRKGKLIPTPEAHQLFAHVTDVYRHVDRLKRVASNLGTGQSGMIRVASTPAFGIDLLPAAVASFLDDHPDTRFEINTLHFEEIVDALLEARVDIGLAFDPAKRPGIEMQQLGIGRFMVLAPPDFDLCGRDTLSLDDLQDCPFVGLNSQGPLGRMLSTYLATSDVDLEVVAWSETYHIAKALVAKGKGVTIADEITARSSIGGDVQTVPLSPSLDFDIAVLHADNTPLSVAGNAFVEHLGREINKFLN